MQQQHCKIQTTTGKTTATDPLPPSPCYGFKMKQPANKTKTVQENKTLWRFVLWVSHSGVNANWEVGSQKSKGRIQNLTSNYFYTANGWLLVPHAVKNGALWIHGPWLPTSYGCRSQIDKKDVMRRLPLRPSLNVSLLALPGLLVAGILLIFLPALLLLFLLLLLLLVFLLGSGLLLRWCLPWSLWGFFHFIVLPVPLLVADCSVVGWRRSGCHQNFVKLAHQFGLKPQPRKRGSTRAIIIHNANANC